MTGELHRERCLRMAKESRDMAATASNEPYRIMLEHIAETWERFAKQFPAETAN